MSERPTYEELERRVQELEKIESEYNSFRKTLRKSEVHYSLLFEHANIGIFIAQDGYLKIPNPCLSQIVGYSRAELEEQPFSLFIHPECLSLVNTRHQESLKGKTGLPQTYDFRVISKNGTIIWVQLSTVLIQFKCRPATLNFLHDITESKQAQEALTESEALFRGMFNDHSAVMLLINPDTGQIIKANQAAVQYYGYPLENMLQMKIQQLNVLLPEKVAEQMRFALNKQVNIFEFQHLLADGQVRDVEVHSTPITIQHQKLLFSIIRDITERKRSEESLQKSLTRYNELAKNVPVGVYVFWIRANGHLEFEYVSDRWCEIHQLKREDVLSDVMRANNLVHPDERDDFLVRNQESFRNRIPFAWEGRFLIGDGKLRWLRIESTPIVFDNGDIRWFGVTSDITDHKRAEEELYKSEAMTKALLNGIPESAFLIESDGTIIAANTTVAQRINCPMEELIGSNIFTRVSHEVSEYRRKFIDQAVQTGRPVQFEDVRSCRNIENRINPIFDQHGNVTRLAIVGIDITERKQAEEVLEAQRARLKSLFEYSGEAILLLDLKNHILEANSAFERIFGYSLEEARGKQMEDLICPERFRDTEAKELDEQSLEGIKGVEIIRKRKDGEEIDIRVSAGPIKIRDNVTGRFVVFDDITDRKRAEKDLKRVRFSIENLTDSLFWVGEEGRFIDFNDAACKKLGYSREELMKMCVPDIDPNFPHERWPAHWEEMKKRKSMRIETVHRTATGEFIPVELTIQNQQFGIRSYNCVLACDITERKRAEEEQDKLQARLAQAQKMESIGTLAGGIAHDFNNILSIIVGNTELAMLDVPEWSPAQDNLKEVREATLRARELVKQILMFARQKEHTVSHIRVEPLAKESVKMLRASIPTTVEIRENIEEGLPPVLADPSQIQQIILNLCTNAGQVMEAEGGTLTFTLGSADLERPLHSMLEEFPPGRYVRMQVSDTGPGIPPEILDRIFDPFFTTKGVGEGTGLGLAVVYGIVQDRHGGITVESEEGRGTTFTVYLPASDAESVEAKREQTRELPRGTERVLFVDDEPMIMKLGQRMLEKQGYIVQTRASGTDALECFKQDPSRFDLVVTDMTMPGMRGDRLAEEIMAIRPDIPVILSTGYSKQISNEKAREMGIRAFVMKPLTQHELANTVREVLDEKLDGIAESAGKSRQEVGGGSPLRGKG